MSKFSDRFAGAFDRMNQVTGDSASYRHATSGTTDTLTVTIVEDVGAADPYTERTFAVLASDLSETPENLDVITQSGRAWAVTRVRDNEDGTYELRTKAAEERT